MTSNFCKDCKFYQYKHVSYDSPSKNHLCKRKVYFTPVVKKEIYLTCENARGKYMFLKLHYPYTVKQRCRHYEKEGV